MKKLMVLFAMAFGLAVFTGCTPSEEQINRIATGVGYAAGLVADNVEMKDDARNTIVLVLTEVRNCVPASGQSFQDAWTPVIEARVAELISSGNIDEKTGKLVQTVSVTAAKAVDYLFDVRFPKAKQYEALVRAGTSGLVDGFLAVFKPVNEGARSVAEQEFDREAYEWFKKNL